MGRRGIRAPSEPDRLGPYSLCDPSPRTACDVVHAIGWPELDSEFYRIGTFMEGTCVRLADAIFSSSRCSADWCAWFYGIDAQQIPVIHTGVDTELFRPPSECHRDGGPVILFVGKLVRNKGVDGTR